MSAHGGDANSLTIRYSRSDLARSAIWSIIRNPSETSRTLGREVLDVVDEVVGHPSGSPTREAKVQREVL